VLEELNVEPKQRADEKMVLLENEKKEDTQLDEANKIDTMAEEIISQARNTNFSH
jgi:hypothetical protein